MIRPPNPMPSWQEYIRLNKDSGKSIQELTKLYLQEQNRHDYWQTLYNHRPFIVSYGNQSNLPTVSSILDINKISTDFSGYVYTRLDGQSNAAAQFSVASETGSIEFTEVSQSSADVSYIRGGQPAIDGYNEPIPGIATILNQTLADGGGITLDGNNAISWYSTQEFSIMAKLNQLMIDNVNNITRIYSHIGAKGGTSVGDHIASNDYNPTQPGTIDKGGHLRIKDRVWEWWYQRYGPNGGNASLEGTDPADYKVFIYWQGESEFLRVAQNQSTLEYANNARDALHAKFESLGYYDYYDAIIEVQPVYFAGYSNTTDLETWASSYASVISSYKAKAEAKPKTAWISIDDMLQAPTSASYKLEAAVPGGSVANKYLHMNPAAHYEIANRIWTEIYE